MELIDGETLRTRILQGPLGLQEVLDITTQSASALVAAHEAAIIHRDIKPRT
jgi:serine/threonine-protein kinase